MGGCCCVWRCWQACRVAQTAFLCRRSVILPASSARHSFRLLRLFALTRFARLYPSSALLSPAPPPKNTHITHKHTHRGPTGETGGPDDYGLGDPATRATSARVNRSGVMGLRRGSEATQSSGSSIYNQLTGAMGGLGLGGGGGAGGAAGRKLLVFVIGGVTRSEMRAVHELSKRTGWEILLGSTAVLKPTSFLSQLRSIGPAP